MTEVNITSNDLMALTTTELEIMQKVLDTGDRGGFYLMYNGMTGSYEAALQTRVATFAGPVGGVAFGANRLLQEAFGPGAGDSPEYSRIYYISHRVAEDFLSVIRGNALSGTNGGNAASAIAPDRHR